MKKNFFIVLNILLLFSPIPINAQIRIIDIASSPNPVGSGARALGMGGAFIGIADDATSASWNPGGLTQLKKPEMSVVLATNQRRDHISYKQFSNASGCHKINTFDLNYFSIAYPFQMNYRNMIFSLNYQHLYNFNKQLSYEYTYIDLDPPEMVERTHVDYKQSGALYAISPAFAIKVNSALSIGLALNIWDKEFCNWDSNYIATGDVSIMESIFDIQVNKKENWAFQGVNFNLGFLWKINSLITIGGVFKSPFRAKIDHDYFLNQWLPSSSGMKHDLKQSNDTEKLDMPMSYGLGVCARLNDLFSIDIDIYRTHWNDYIKHTAYGVEINPITGKPVYYSKSKPTTQVRLGAEYLFIFNQIIYPIHMGIFYDPEPAFNNPEDFYGFSVGTGIVFNPFVFDIAYEYRFGNDVSITSFTIGHENPIQDVRHQTLSMSMIYHF